VLRGLASGLRAGRAFTLTELLVTVSMIGILAAVAVPLFLSQRDNARNAAAQVDVQRLAAAQETFWFDDGVFVDTVGALEGGGFVGSDGVVHGVVVAGDRFAVCASHVGVGDVWVWTRAEPAVLPLPGLNRM